MNADWEKLEVYFDAASAEVVAGFLQSESIPTRIVRREPVPGLAEGYTLWVSASLLQKARDVLSQAPLTDAELAEFAVDQQPQDGNAP